MKSQHCHACGVEIPTGGLFYVCSTRIVSGFDGFVEEPEEEIDRLVKDAARGLAGRSPQEIMDDVYQEIELILCNTCRLRLRDFLLLMRREKRGEILPFRPR